MKCFGLGLPLRLDAGPRAVLDFSDLGDIVELPAWAPELFSADKKLNGESSYYSSGSFADSLNIYYLLFLL